MHPSRQPAIAAADTAALAPSKLCDDTDFPRLTAGVSSTSSFCSGAATPISSLEDHFVLKTASREKKTSGCCRPCTPWPEDRIARGFLTMRSTPRKHDRGVLTLFTIERSLLTISVEQPDGASPGKVSTQFPVRDAIVTLYPYCYDMFKMTTHQGSSQIYLFAADQEKRNKWVAVFRRLGIRVRADKVPVPASVEHR